MLYKGKSYSFIHIKLPYRAPQAKFFGFSVLYKGKSYSFIQEKHPYRAQRDRAADFGNSGYLIVYVARTIVSGIFLQYLALEMIESHLQAIFHGNRDNAHTTSNHVESLLRGHCKW